MPPALARARRRKTYQLRVDEECFFSPLDSSVYLGGSGNTSHFTCYGRSSNGVAHVLC
jgi:hypothetical protein